MGRLRPQTQPFRSSLGGAPQTLFRTPCPRCQAHMAPRLENRQIRRQARPTAQHLCPRSRRQPAGSSGLSPANIPLAALQPTHQTPPLNPLHGPFSAAEPLHNLPELRQVKREDVRSESPGVSVPQRPHSRPRRPVRSQGLGQAWPHRPWWGGGHGS